MTASKLAKLTAVLCGSLCVPVALAHPGHEHSRGIMEGLLHAAATEWAAALMLLVLTVVAGYTYARKACKA